MNNLISDGKRVVDGLLPGLHGFGDELKGAIDRLDRLVKLASGRMGEEFDKKFGDSTVQPNIMYKVVDSNIKNLHKLLHYFMAFSVLGQSPAWDDTESWRPQPLARENFIWSFDVFCKTHRAQEGDAKIVLEEPLNINGGQMTTDFLAIFGDFVKTSGQAMFDKHTSACLRKWVTDICSSIVRIMTVHPSVLADKGPGELLPLLVLSPGLDDIVPDSAKRLELDGTPEDEYTLLNEPHDAALRSLTRFTNAIHFEDLSVPAIFRKGIGANAASTDEIKMPTTTALAIFQVICGVYDVALLGTYLHKLFLLPRSMGTPIPLHDILNHIVFVLRLLHIRLVSLDTLASSEGAIGVERDGWVLPAPMAQVRAWRQSMALYAARTRDELLKLWVECLEEASEAARAAIPSWESCFSVDGGMDERMLAAMLKGRMQKIVESHNRVHSLLVGFNWSAKLLEITPVLAVHPLLSAPIAVAKTSLDKSATASMLIMGISNLEKYRLDPDGAAKANKFLSDHNIERHRSVPPAFWQEFRNIEAHASPALKREGMGAVAQPPAAPPGPTSDSASSAAAAPQAQGGRANSTGGAVKSASSVKFEGAPILKRRRH